MFFHGFSLAQRFFTLLRKKLKYFPFLNLHRRLISFIYRAGNLVGFFFFFCSLQWCLDNIIRQECQFKRNLCRILKITDVGAPQEEVSLACSSSQPQLLRSSSVAVSTSHDFEDKATITAFCKQRTRAITTQGSTC